MDMSSKKGFSAISAADILDRLTISEHRLELRAAAEHAQERETRLSPAAQQQQEHMPATCTVADYAKVGVK